VLGRVHTGVVGEFLEDIPQSRWQRPHTVRHGKRETRRVTGCRVRVLPDNENVNSFWRKTEGAKNPVRGRKNVLRRGQHIECLADFREETTTVLSKKLLPGSGQKGGKLLRPQETTAH
jgi:hypothetical protein